MKKYLLLMLLFSCQSAVDDELNFAEDPKKQEVVSESKTKEKVAEVLSLEPTIYFAYDSSSLSRSARTKLKNNLLWLQANKKAKIIIEGHCDERGTKEYNLALGERRAYALKRFFVNGGISSKRVKVLSYGEERPAALGSTESQYRLNRRAELKLK